MVILQEDCPVSIGFVYTGWSRYDNVQLILKRRNEKKIK